MVADSPSLAKTRSFAEALFGAWNGPDTPGSRARSALGTVLLADGPHPDLADQLALFGQLVGSWDLEVTGYPANAPPVQELGEWHFGWALDGRAIVDVWICPRRDLRAHRPQAGDYGATLRFFDPAIGAWRSTWIGPVRHVVQPFIARQEGAEIVLDGAAQDGVMTRWIFAEITADSFRWRHVTSTDGWATRQLHLEMSARRQAAG